MNMFLMFIHMQRLHFFFTFSCMTYDHGMSHLYSCYFYYVLFFYFYFLFIFNVLIQTNYLTLVILKK